MDAAEVVSAYAACWERGDHEAAWSYYADEVVMRIPGRGSLAGTHEGVEAVTSCIRALRARASDGRAEVEVLAWMATGDRMAVLLREAVHRDNARLELRRVNLYRVADGKITDIDIFEANQYEVDEFFG